VLTKPFALSQICEIAQEITERKKGRAAAPPLTLAALGSLR
jgi:hypothetical protein